MDQQLEDMLRALDGAAMEMPVGALENMLHTYTFISRFLLPILAAVIIFRALKSLLRESYEPEVWAYLSLPNGSRMALYHWENTIGRARSSDVVLNYPTLSRSHLALIRDDKARWTAIDLGSKGGVTVNGNSLDGKARVEQGDVLGLGGVEVALLDLDPEERAAQSHYRTKPGRWITPSGTFFFITLFQVLLMLQHVASSFPDVNPQVPTGFLALTGIMWGYFFFIRALRRTGFEIEAIAFFLCSIGLSIIAGIYPDEMMRTVFLIFVGLVIFFVLCWILRDLRWAKRFRWPIALGGVLFLAIGFIYADYQFGARRWIEIAGIMIQPAEFVKVAFIFAGAASLERLFTRRNLFLFIAYAGMCVGILALMNDFGSAAVFFTAFLVIAFLRSGDMATISLALASLVLAAMLVLTIRPHVATRFDTWGNVWADPWGRGMQQALTMSYTASGGFFGLGAGNGSLSRVFAAYTDMVFGVMAEELGLIVAILAVVAIFILGVFAIRSSANARSSFYVIAAGATVTMFMAQVILNVFGSLDVIPFTGITFPFVSRGGSSMIASWAMLAFIKAADTRQNASLAIKLGKKVKGVPISAGDYYDDSADYEEHEDDYYEDDIYDEDEEFAEPLEGGIDSRYFNEKPGVHYNDDSVDPRYFGDHWEDRR
ncbi:MAG: FtsW/RodA/SpoVE family cell cycle protein [Oscillospiraceae bacterium]|nr:FtsW/RodA/SpoVE family cell cycle protein [Oscillospiraceae bacterium]